MSEAVEARLEQIPVVNALARLCKRIRIPGFEGLSLYDLLEIYIYGIVKGTLSSRASSIAFSLFMALFPLIIFLVTLLPFCLPSSGNTMVRVLTRFFWASWNPSCQMPRRIISRRSMRGSKAKREMAFCPLLFSCPSFWWPTESMLFSGVSITPTMSNLGGVSSDSTSTLWWWA